MFDYIKNSPIEIYIMYGLTVLTVVTLLIYSLNLNSGEKFYPDDLINAL